MTLPQLLQLNIRHKVSVATHVQSAYHLPQHTIYPSIPSTPASAMRHRSSHAHMLVFILCPCGRVVVWSSPCSTQAGFEDTTITEMYHEADSTNRGWLDEAGSLGGTMRAVHQTRAVMRAMGYMRCR